VWKPHGQDHGTFSHFEPSSTLFGRIYIHPRVSPWYSALRVNKETDLNLNSGKIKKLQELEKDSIIKALKTSDGNIILAAQQLGISWEYFLCEDEEAWN